MTGHPIELPTSVTRSTPRSSRNRAAACARSGTSRPLGRPAAATEAGQVGHEGVELVGEPLGGRQQVATRQPEAVDMHHHAPRRRWAAIRGRTRRRRPRASSARRARSADAGDAGAADARSSAQRPSVSPWCAPSRETETPRGTSHPGSLMSTPSGPFTGDGRCASARLLGAVRRARAYAHTPGRSSAW